MTSSFTELQRDALCVMHALLGVVSENFRMVSVSRREERIEVRFHLATHNDEDMEEIEDFETEFSALYSRPILFDIKVIVSEDQIMMETPSESSMIVFRRRERISD